ncbi:MAG: thermonuclease family protein [Thermoleophilia bacterium]
MTITGTVAYVFDGDTIAVADPRGSETRVRLLGIDTPETRKPDTPVQCWGPQASQRTHALLPLGTRVRVVSDPTQDLRDRYHRFLGYVFIAGATRSVNLRLVAGGDARVYVYDPAHPFRHLRGYRTAERHARAARRGLWGPPCWGDTTRPAP